MSTLMLLMLNADADYDIGVDVCLDGSAAVDDSTVDVWCQRC